MGKWIESVLFWVQYGILRKYMKNKFCAKCGVLKLLKYFYFNKNIKDGHSSICKNCDTLNHKNYYNKFPWKKTYQHIQRRCNNIKCKAYKNYGGRGIKLLINIEELKKLWFRDKAYLLKNPSIDRIDNDGNYTYENCRYIEFGKNSTERNIRVSSKIINQYNLQGIFMRSWKSAREVERELGINNSDISKTCTGKLKHAGGYIWKFKLI